MFQALHLEHQVPETDRDARDLSDCDRVVAGVAVQEHALGDTEIDRVAEAEPQTLREELDNPVRCGAEQERMSHTPVPTDELDAPTRLNRDTPRPRVRAQTNLIGRAASHLSPQHIGRKAHPLLDRTLNNDVSQSTNPAHGVLSCADLRPIVWVSNVRKIEEI